MSYELVGLLPIERAGNITSRCPTPAQSTELLSSKDYDGAYEMCLLCQRVGDEIQPTTQIKAVIGYWSDEEDNYYQFSFCPPDNSFRENDIKRHVKRKLKLMSEDDDRGYDSIHTGIDYYREK